MIEKFTFQPKMIHLTEDILHFVWKHALFDLDDLMTTEGESLQFISRGKLNQNSGPDFSNAKIKIGDTTWVGNVEIHVHSSDWYLHHHQNDAAYDNVILHVVYFHDREVKIKNLYLPVFELKNRIPPSLFRKYKMLLKKEEDLPCRKLINEVKSSSIVQQIEMSLKNRLERKANEVIQLVKRNNSDWEETTFQLLLLSMIGKINYIPAQWLAEKLNLKIIRSNNNDVLQLEALFLGLAGWLGNSEIQDSFTMQLKAEFIHQKNKYLLEELNSAIWKMGKMRPAQFPIFRLSQLADLLFKNSYYFSFFMEADIKEILKLFSRVEANEYWKNHCQLNKEMKPRSVKLGQMQQELLLINVVAPILFAYGIFIQNESLKIKAINLLKNVKPEKNAIIFKWKEHDIRLASAFETQGLIELHNSLCIQKKCLSCNIGMQIIRA